MDSSWTRITHRSCPWPRRRVSPSPEENSPNLLVCDSIVFSFPAEASLNDRPAPQHVRSVTNPPEGKVIILRSISSSRRKINLFPLLLLSLVGSCRITSEVKDKQREEDFYCLTVS